MKNEFLKEHQEGTLYALEKYFSDEREIILSQLNDMFGGVIGARHPIDSDVIYFDIILTNAIHTLEISNYEIQTGTWRRKAERLLKSINSGFEGKEGGGE